jgi:hypothetical protein
LDAVEKTMLQHCKQYLEDRGFVVLPKERGVIVQAHYSIPYMEFQLSRVSAERLADAAQETNASRIVREVIAKGLVVHTRHTCNGSARGREMVFRSSIAVIAPSEDEV